MTTNELRDAAQLALTAMEAEMAPEWDCNSYHPLLAPAVKSLRAALTATTNEAAAQADGSVQWPTSDEIAYELLDIGWRDSCDAQHTEIAKWWAGIEPKLRRAALATQPVQAQGDDEFRDARGEEWEGLAWALAEPAPDERMFRAAISDLAAVAAELRLDPDDGGAEPIIDAIRELRAAAVSPTVPPSQAEPLQTALTAKQLIPVLRQAMDSAGLLPGDRADLIGHFCNAYNAQFVAPSQAGSCQASEGPSREAIDTLVYELRQAGSDDTYSIVRAALLRFSPPAGRTLTEIPAEIIAIAERLHTQDNRITDNPLFAVQQKRRIYGVDEGYCDNAEWVLDGETVALEDGEDRPADARRVGYIDKWEFVTGGLTEQGCKDYIACNGHNLNEPRIYAYGSYRNAEFIALRKWLMSLAASSTTAKEN